jgi:DNA-binding beta-propeller fold protein YncE
MYRRRSAVLASSSASVFIAGLAVSLVLTGGRAQARASALGDLTPLGCIGATENTSGCGSNANLLVSEGVAASPDGLSVYATGGSANALQAFARGDFGVLTAAGCQGDMSSGPAGCVKVPGLASPFGVAVSPDGKNVYAASPEVPFAGGSNTIDAFTRSASGAISYLGCIGTGANPSGCAATANLKGVVAVTVSPDGNNVYATAIDSNAVEVFARGASGTLTPAGCLGNPGIPGNPGVGPGNCNGADGLGGPQALAVSPDGKNVYVGSDNALAVLDRASNGALSSAGCIGASSGGPKACSSTANVDSVRSVVLSPDGANVYVASWRSNAVQAFARIGAGALKPAGCYGDPAPAGCTLVTSLTHPNGLALSPDGKSLYVAAEGSNSVIVFGRAADGTLSAMGCIGNSANPNLGPPQCIGSPGLGSVHAITVSPDGKNVYATSQNALVEFGRATESGSGTSTTTSTATTTTTTVSTSTVTTVAAPTTTRRGLSASVSATITRRRGGARVLVLKIQVSAAVSGEARLVGRHGQVLLDETLAVKPGASKRSIPIGAKVKSGTDQLVVSLSDSAGHRKTVRADLLVPG